jgi:hypothetical protein
MIETVKLNEKEQTLFDEIQWEIDTIRGGEFPEDNWDKLGELTESLLKRKAIPEIRRRIFDDPEFNPGGHGKSRIDIFHQNGRTNPEIIRHPHFLPWLRYFVEGPDLPEPTIAGFLKIIEDDHGTEGMVVDQLKTFVRKEVRERGLDRHDAAKQFYRLCVEADKKHWADYVRKAAMEARRK